MPLKSLGSNRDQLSGLAAADRDRLIKQQVLVGDPRRWRPRWFDGRFLAASDLQAEQNYFLVRQSDLGRAGGSGIFEGLMVSLIPDVEQLRIEAGSGVTDTGELIVILEELQVNPADVPEIRRLDAAFGLEVIPNEPARNRTGLYVLGLRLVEWTANPIGAYPTSLTGQRTVEDATIVEGVAVSLIPYPDKSNAESWERRRAHAAREIFVEGSDRGLNAGVLPLALVALRGNLIESIDPFMVRREAGAERPVGMDFGFGARALREAHLLQFQRHLVDALNANSDQPFAATTYFDALPPVGQFPSGTLDADQLTQRFFPAGIEVDLSFVPEDELSALIEESLLLPPIDLTDSLEERAGTGVVVLVPLSRADFTQRRASLPNWDAQLPLLRPAFLQIKGMATPKELLLAQQFRPAVAAPVAAPEEQAWRQLLRDALKNPLLWYVRRRHLPIPANVAATPVNATSVQTGDPQKLVQIIRESESLSERLGRLKAVQSPEVDLLSKRLSDNRFIERPALIKSILAKAAGDKAEPLRAESVVENLAPATDPKLGEGLAAIEKQDPALAETLNGDRLAETGLLVEVDKLAREVPPAKFAEFSVFLKEDVKNPETLSKSLVELRAKFVQP